MLAAERCVRCRAHVCDDCLAFAGTRVLCAVCARAARRWSAIGRAAAALAVSVAGALLGLGVVEAPRAARPVNADYAAITLKHAVRACAAHEVEVLITSLVMHGHDREAVVAGDAFAAECAMPTQTAEVLARARARLASP